MVDTALPSPRTWLPARASSWLRFARNMPVSHLLLPLLLRHGLEFGANSIVPVDDSALSVLVLPVQNILGVNSDFLPKLETGDLS